MRETEKLTGMVLKVSPVGEMDKRLVILTRERGKITAFARGARRPGNPFMAVSRPFAFGQFSLYAGRDSYTLQSAEISNYLMNWQLIWNVPAMALISWNLPITIPGRT